MKFRTKSKNWAFFHDSAWNVPSGEERGETDVFVGFSFIKMTSEQSRKIAIFPRV